jgi:hypothetical protein
VPQAARVRPVFKEKGAAWPLRRAQIDTSAFEASSVARAEGVELSDADCGSVLEEAISTGGSHISSLVASRRAKRRSEWDERNAVIVRLARRHGIRVPVNATVPGIDSTIIESSSCARRRLAKCLAQLWKPYTSVALRQNGVVDARCVKGPELQIMQKLEARVDGTIYVGPRDQLVDVGTVGKSASIPERIRDNLRTLAERIGLVSSHATVEAEAVISDVGDV